MATRSGIPDTVEACLAAATEPSCGERLRRLIRRLCLAPDRGRLAASLRRRIPVFVACEEALQALSDELTCPVYVFYTACVHPPKKPPVSYVIVGRAAIVSLDERIKGREKEIGDALLHLVPGIEAVYAKKATIGEHRVQDLIHIAGKKIDETIYVENGLRIPVFLGKVYINPRLASEHARLAGYVREGEHVLDMFAGVGGFALNISAQGRAASVTANDVNIYAVRSIMKAIVLNRRKLLTPILVLNEDAARLPAKLRPVYDRVIMNLPHAALEFVPAALRLCSPDGCILHIYIVARSQSEAVDMARTRYPCLRVIGGTRVLDYAPGKYIFRVDAQYSVKDEAACKA